MSGVLRVKAGVSFARIAPGGFRLLGTLDRLVRTVPFDLTLTCACEGHPPDDPHTRGCAYDVRTHGLPDDAKHQVLRAVLLDLQDGAQDAPLEVSGGLATTHFFGWLEHAGAETEHLHFQVRKGTTYP